jgi:ABC-type bacteriocin/lantibiotic exporter with double-glycine peptidase domain
MGVQTIVEVGRISNGQQQRLLIARALLTRPSLLILDEATNAIPDALQARIFARIRERGIGCLVVSHRESVWAIADIVHVLGDGTVDSNPSRLLTLRPNEHLRTEEEVESL